MTRVLGAVRQSRTRDRSVSPAAQRKAIQLWAKGGLSGGPVVRITEDLSTSGAVSAFKRRELGPWLTDPDKIAAWDTLVATKLDRVCRDTADYFRLRQWCKDHGKRLTFINNPELDESTPGGKALAGILAIFAEFERDMIRERNREQREALTSSGRWPGGRLPYGWRYNPDSGELEEDTGSTGDVLRTMADMAIEGKSFGQIANWLNGGNGSVCHLTMIRHKWEITSVRKVIRSDRTMELLGEAKSAELRAAMRKREQTRGERVGGHMLLRVAFCGSCGGPLYCALKRRLPSGGHYRCLPCKTYLRMDRLEQRTEDSLLFLYGDLELTEYKLVPGDDHQSAIHALRREIDMLGKISGTEAVIAAKNAEVDHLSSLPFEPDHYVEVPQGITVAEHWATLSTQDKGSFLRKRHVRVLADKHRFEFHGGLFEESEAAPGHLVAVTAVTENR